MKPVAPLFQNQQTALLVAVEIREADRVISDKAGNRSARSAMSLGARFSSTRSFKQRDPVRNTGEELVHRLKVFLFQIREISQYLVFRHSGRQIGGEIVDCEAQPTNTRLSAHFARFNSNTRVQASHRICYFYDISQGGTLTFLAGGSVRSRSKDRKGGRRSQCCHPYGCGLVLPVPSRRSRM